MGAGHSHSHEAPALGLSATARRATLALLVVVGVVTIAGLIWLWPISHPSVGGSSMTAEGVDAVSGRITALAPCEDTGESTGQGPQHACQIAQVEITGGPSAGQTVPVELIGVSGLSGLQVGDGVNVAEVAGIDGEASTWAFVTADRMPVLIGFLIVFVLAVLGVAGRKGLFGLLGLIVAGAVLFGFMIPALTSGHPAVAVAIIGSTAIMFVVLYLAHGISWRTTSAFVGTWLSLIVTTGLGALGVWMARLSGMSSEETLALAGVLGNLDFPDILTCSLVIGGLGVLNDVTITQASSVWEIRAAGPHLTRRQLFTSGMRIGRDHHLHDRVRVCGRVPVAPAAAVAVRPATEPAAVDRTVLRGDHPHPGQRHRAGAQRPAHHRRRRAHRGGVGSRQGARPGPSSSRRVRQAGELHVCSFPQVVDRAVHNLRTTL